MQRASAGHGNTVAHKTEIVVEHHMIGADRGNGSGGRSYVLAKALVKRTADLPLRAVGDGNVFLEGGGLIELPAVTDRRLEPPPEGTHIAFSFFLYFSYRREKRSALSITGSPSGVSGIMKSGIVAIPFFT
jgi:hypothetical protein